MDPPDPGPGLVAIRTDPAVLEAEAIRDARTAEFQEAHERWLDTLRKLSSHRLRPHRGDVVSWDGQLRPVAPADRKKRDELIDNEDEARLAREYASDLMTRATVKHRETLDTVRWRVLAAR